MGNPGYITLTRQAGLLREMRVVANNIANSATDGYRQEGLIFSEFMQETGGDRPALSMAAARVRNTSLVQGQLTRTGGAFDLAIEGPGFFLIETPRGERLTRAGAFSPNANGDLVTKDGFRLLDAGRAPVFVPPGAGEIGLSPDGTLSAGGRPLAQIGLFQPAQADDLAREGGVMFRAEGGIMAQFDGRIVQGFIEGANVEPIDQMARMIEIQRAYEMGQSFLQAEDERIRSALKTLIR
jgi:flagellar basal-body rod protein FlgF